MNPSTFEDVSMETNGNYTTVSPSVRRIRTLKRRKEQEKENSKNQVGHVLSYFYWGDSNNGHSQWLIMGLCHYLGTLFGYFGILKMFNKVTLQVTVL